MRKIYIIMSLLMAVVTAKAQVPNFAGTAGKGHLYGYFSVKARPGINAQETYSALEYGFTDWFASGADYYSGGGTSYLGYVARFGKLQLNDNLNIGAQLTPSFDMNENMKFSYMTSALYLNGNITKDGNLFYVADTWWTVNDGDAKNTIDQWLYLAYNFSLKNGDGITPMVGTIYSWEFDRDADIAAGFYYSHNKFNFYLWANDFLKDHPRMVAGFEFNL